MKKKILIGSLNKDMRGAIPIITKAFMEGLSDRYDFIPFYMDRRRRNIQSRINLTNIYYLIKHYISWIGKIVKYKPDIVHYPVTSYWNLEKSLLFLSTARILGVDKTIGHLHGGSFDKFWSELTGFRKKFARKRLEKLDGFIVLSEYWKEFFENEVKFRKIGCVNNPISASFENYFSNYSRDYRKDNFLFIGAVGRRKGAYDIIESADKLEFDPEITLVGPEDIRGDIQKINSLIEEKGIENIKLAGSKYRKEKIGIVKDSGVFILPSYNENFPLVVIEASCASMPIIATPVGALPEFFDHMKNIYYVEPGNIMEIRNAIEFMVKNPEERERLGKAARKVFDEQLSRDKIMKQLDNIYTAISG